MYAKATIWLAAYVAMALVTPDLPAVAQSGSPNIVPDKPGQELMAGWSLLKEGEAVGNIELDANRPTEPDAKFLHIVVTKTAQPGRGRIGAISGIPIDIQEGKWYEATFRAVAEGRSVGIVFSLEGADGKVLARTTQPEIGRNGRGGRGNDDGEANPIIKKYTVALHARQSDPNAHLVITPIEPTSVWLDKLLLVPRTTNP